MLKQKLKTVAYNLTHFYGFYAKLADHHRIFFGNPENKRLEGVRVRRPFRWVVLPVLLTTLFGIRALLAILYRDSIRTKWHEALSFTGMFNFEERFYCELTVVIWTTLVAMITFYMLSENILDYTFMAVLTVDSKSQSRIKPHDLRLTKQTWQIFAKYRRIFLLLGSGVTLSLVLLTVIVVVANCYQQSIIEQSILLFTFWLFGFAIAWFICCSNSKF